MNLRLPSVCLALFFSLVCSLHSFGQSVTLSSPASSSTSVDSITVSYTVSEPAGTPQQIQIVFTYTSGPAYEMIGQNVTLTMKSAFLVSGSKTFTFRMADPFAATNDFTASLPNGLTTMPEGLYSSFCQYVRPSSTGGTTLKSTVRTNSLFDGLTQPPRFSPLKTASSVNATTDVITLSNHNLTNGLPVRVERSNLPTTTTYYVSVIDTSTFKLATTAGGSAYADFTSTAPPLVILPLFQNAQPVTVNTTTDIVTKVGHGFATDDLVQVIGTSAPTSTLYYVSRIDADTFKLATTAGGSTYVDFTTAGFPMVARAGTSSPFLFGDTGNRLVGGNSYRVSYNLGEGYLTGSASLTFTGPFTVTLSLADNLLNADFGFSRTAISAPGYITSSSTSSLPDGTYSVRLSYQDRFGHPPAYVDLSNVTIDSSTTAPIFGTLDPSDHVTVLNPLVSGTLVTSASSKIYYTLPENAFNGSASLVFTAGSTTRTYPLPDSPLTHICDLAGTLPPDGTYTVTLSYRDEAGNAAASTSVSGVIVDGTTQAPTLNLASSSAVGPNFLVSYTLPETPLSGSVELSFAGASTVTLSLDNSAAASFTLQTADLQGSSSSITHATAATLPAGAYTVTLRYKDQYGNPFVSVVATNFNVVTTTAIPTLSLPLAANTYNRIPILYTLPEAALAGSVTLKFFSGGNLIATLGMIDTAPAGTTYIDPAVNPQGTGPYLTGTTLATGSFLPDGIYDVVLSYRNALQAPVATTVVAGITIHTQTAPPLLAKPLGGSRIAKIPVDYTLPEPAAEVYVQFIATGSGALVNSLAMAPAQSVRFILDPANVTASSAVLSASGGTTLADGSYTVRLLYRDVYGNPASMASVTNVTIDTETVAPTIFAPVNSQAAASSIHVVYALPEVPKPGSVKLNLVGAATIGISLNDSIGGDFVLNPVNIAGSSASILAATQNVIPDGAYTFTVTYQDEAVNAPQSTSVANVRIDTVTDAPVLVSPATLSVHGKNVAVNYILPEALQPGSAKLQFTAVSGGADVTITLSDVRTKSFTLDRTNLAAAAAQFTQATANVLTDGTYTVTLSYRDVAGNPVASATSATVTFAGLPTGTSLAATAITETTATLGLSANPQGLATTAEFFLGATSLGTVAIPAGAAAAPITQAVTGLTGDTRYAASVLLTNALGTVASAAITFTTQNPDAQTDAPVLILPVAGAVATPNLAVSYTLPEAAKANSVKLSFAGPVSADLTMSTAQAVAFTLNPAALLASSTAITATSRPTLPDGSYAVTLSYQDAKGNAAASVTVGNVSFDSATQTPALISPAAGSTNGDTFTISYALPEEPQPGSATLSFNATSGGANVTFTLTDARSKVFAVNRNSLASAGMNIAHSSGLTLTEGTYDVVLSYCDAGGNARASVTHSNVVFASAPTISAPNVTVKSPTTATAEVTVNPHSLPTTVAFFRSSTLLGTTLVPAGTTPVTVTQELAGLTSNTSYAVSASADNAIGTISSTPFSFTTDNADAETQPPILLAPVAGAVAAPKLAVSYSLPEAPKAGSVKLSFVGPATVELAMNVAQTVSFTLDPTDVASSSPAILSAPINTIPDGAYAVTLSYQDSLGNAAASVTVGNVTFDSTTQSPLLISPAAGSKLGVDFALSYVLPEAPQAGSAMLKFTPTAGGTTVTLNLNDATSSTFNLKRTDLAGDHPQVTHASSKTLAAGIYDVSLSYQDSHGNTLATQVNENVAFGETPQFGVPVVTVTGPTTATLDVTVAPRSAATTVEFFVGSTSLGTTVIAAGTLPATVGKAVTGLTSKTSYAASISATNDFGSAASAPVLFTTENGDAETEAPTLISPKTGARLAKDIAVSYQLPEAPLAGSVKLSFIGPVTANFALPDAQAAEFTFDATQIATSAEGLASAPVSSLPDGTYTVLLSYQDASGNAPAFASAGAVTIDTVTNSPLLADPAPDAALGSTFSVSYQLPETPKSGTVTMLFHAVSGGSDLTIQLGDQAAASFGLDRENLYAATLNVVSATAPTLANGTYDVTLSYRDELGNLAAFQTHSGVVFGSSPIMNPPSVTVLSSTSARLNVTVAAASGDAVVAFLLGDTLESTTIVPAGTSMDFEKIYSGLTPGRGYAAVVRIANRFGSSVSQPKAFRTFDTQSGGDGENLDPVGFKSRVSVGRFERVAAGSSLPEDATYYAFGIPAINDAGLVAVQARVRSSLGTKATIVAGNPLRVVAVEGDPAPGIAGATFARFTDPVIDANGRVAFMATLAGAAITPKNATTLWTNAPGGVLRLVARVGDLAPDAGSARFQSLTSFSLQSAAASGVAPEIGEVVFTAMLQQNPKTGVTKGSDAGIWSLKFAADGSLSTGKCLIREGVTQAGGATVRLFRSLDVVKGSPGQARSHLTEGTLGLLATLSDGREVILEVSAADGVEVVATSRAALGSAKMRGATLKKLGVPAVNIDGDHLAFLGSLVPDSNGVTAANSTGIFYAAPNLAPLALAGDPAPGLPATTFGTFRDPVIETVSGEAAFLAALAGKGAAGGRSQSLWWTKQGELALLARSGDALPGAEGTKLRGFASIAFPVGSGPVFVGVLAAGTEAVNGGNNTGLWVANATTGELTLLLRKGQKVLDGVGLLKRVKNFSVLKPVAGSPGAARSYNATGGIVCQVIFEDASQSIMTFTATP